MALTDANLAAQRVADKLRAPQATVSFIGSLCSTV